MSNLVQVQTPPVFTVMYFCGLTSWGPVHASLLLLLCTAPTQHAVQPSQCLVSQYTQASGMLDLAFEQYSVQIAVYGFCPGAQISPTAISLYPEEHGIMRCAASVILGSEHCKDLSKALNLQCTCDEIHTKGGTGSSNPMQSSYRGLA